ncbi:MAG: 50S ribosomal protein L29 [Holosporales bacterium]|jgi:large subunit ribosomal protein L29|nr:50S ribosomal protein L29 [Holosporales bacterium]
MSFEELKNKSTSELYTIIEERRKEQLNLRIQIKTGQDVKLSRIREVRRDIAKVMTRLQQIKLGKKYA